MTHIKVHSASRLFVLLVVALIATERGAAQTCPTNCTVSLYAPATSCSVSGSTVNLQCAWGGPNTCCNPSIKHSTSGTYSGVSCPSQSSFQYTYKNAQGTYQTSISCCNPIETDSGCTQVLSPTICTSSIKVG